MRLVACSDKSTKLGNVAYSIGIVPSLNFSLNAKYKYLSVFLVVILGMVPVNKFLDKSRCASLVKDSSIWIPIEPVNLFCCSAKNSIGLTSKNKLGRWPLKSLACRSTTISSSVANRLIGSDPDSWFWLASNIWILYQVPSSFESSWPWNWLFPMYKAWRFVALSNGSSVPVNSLCSNTNVCNFVMAAPMPSGSVCWNLFSATFKVLKLTSEFIHDGKEPEISLPCRIKTSNDWRWLMESGRVPRKLFPNRFKSSKSNSNPISYGIVPSKFIFGKNISRMCSPSWHETPISIGDPSLVSKNCFHSHTSLPVNHSNS